MPLPYHLRSRRSEHSRLSSFRRPHRRLPDHGSDLDPAVVHLVSYEITDEPIDSPLMRRLSAKDRERLSDVGAKVIEGAADMAPILEPMVEEFPNIPQVYNYLTNAYQNAGQYDKAAEWIEKTYQRFPNYLFGVSNYCLLLLSKGQVEKVTRILGGRYGIQQWITNRRRYHVTEFVAFHGLMARYFAALGESEIAESYYRMLHDVAPDHPLTRDVARFCGVNLLKAILKRFSRPNLLSWLDREGEDPAEEAPKPR